MHFRDRISARHERIEQRNPAAVTLMAEVLAAIAVPLRGRASQFHGSYSEMGRLKILSGERALHAISRTAVRGG